MTHRLYLSRQESITALQNESRYRQKSFNHERSIMNAKELAEKLTGMESPVRIPKELVAEAKANGLVIVYGASDDLMEFEGAINDEVGVYDGGVAFIDSKGLTPDFNELCEEKNFDGLQDYFSRFDERKEIEALWCKEGNYSFTFKTDIPHATWEVVEDGQPYCRGIVFSLASIEQ
jgi:hypothetical protein